MGLFKVKFRFILSAVLVALDFVLMQLRLGNLYLVNLSTIIFILFIYKDDLRAILLRALSKSNS